MYNPIFFLLTDFGLQDPYVGQMKAILWSQVPEAKILDLSHGVRPHNVLQAAFFLASSWPYLPSESIGLAVIDPGVGTSRSILLLRRGEKTVLAPDNGLLSLLLNSWPDCRVWSINTSTPEKEISSTFHGRDVFAPLASGLAQGVGPDQLGTEIEPAKSRVSFWTPPSLQADRVQAAVVHVDHFGNCVLNLEAELWGGRLPADKPIDLLHPRLQAVYPVSTYAQIPDAQVGILAGSQGYLELACNQRSCARDMGLDIGDQCILKF